MKQVFIEVGGQQYRLATFDTQLMGKFLEWARQVLPTHLSLIRAYLKDMPENIAERAVKSALSDDLNPLEWDSAQVQSLARTPRGNTKLFALMLARYQPELTDEQAERICNDCIAEHGQEYLGSKLAECALISKAGTE